MSLLLNITFLKTTLLTLFLIAPTAYGAYPLQPDPEVTSGDMCSEDDHDFYDYRYPEEIAYCARKVSASQKRRIYEEYNIPEKCRHRYTIDHFIPLALGGNNSDVNLWPEHKLVKASRPKLEIELYWSLSKGEISQNKAVKIIVAEKTKFRERLQNAGQRLAVDCDAPAKE